MSAQVQSSPPNLGMQVTTFENPMGIDGFEFVEFAAPDGKLLHELFARMGFTAVLRHRSRPITVYRQGGVNFLVSIFPFVIIMNWLYYKTGRSLLSAIVFHVSAGYFNEIFATHPDSKVIQTGLLIVLAVFIVLREKRFFFDQPVAEEREDRGVCARPC